VSSGGEGAPQLRRSTTTKGGGRTPGQQGGDRKKDTARHVCRGNTRANRGDNAGTPLSQPAQWKKRWEAPPDRRKECGKSNQALLGEGTYLSQNSSGELIRGRKGMKTIIRHKIVIQEEIKR